MNFNLIGNIGCGKSTLISLYNEMDLFDNIKTAGEPFINGDSLNDFYGDLKNNSFIFQWHVISELTTRNRQFKGQDVLLERNLEDAIFVFTPVLHEQGYISDKQKSILTNVYTSLDDKIKADYYIYLQCDPLVAFHRLQRRGRECENKITLDYVTKLHNEYEIFAKSIIQKFGTDKIIILNGNQQPKDIIEDLVTFIRSKFKQEYKIILNIYYIIYIRCLKLKPR
jgi:deoxyadenosine/deoxycytidine kinase